jgi:hypothetical protein
MSNLQLSALVRAALTRLTTCHKHETPYTPPGRVCELCLLESMTGRTHRTMAQIMAGCVAPSWEREQL